MNTRSTQEPARRPPRLVAVSGMVFATLYIASLASVRVAMPAEPTLTGEWIADPLLRNWVGVALNLTPFTGISFLWFMAVLHNRFGDLEGRFFVTVFLGSGLLFVAMLFVAAATARGFLSLFATEGGPAAYRDTYVFGRTLVDSLMNTFAVKMSAVFTFVTSTIGLRTGIFPRYIAYVGYAMALVTLLIIADFAWITLAFPAWVLLVSISMLVNSAK